MYKKKSCGNVSYTQLYVFYQPANLYTRGRADSTQADRIEEGLGIATSL